MADTIKEIDKLIETAEKSLASLHRQRKNMEAQKLTPTQEFAIVLHSKRCRHNHTDGCGWYYEMKDGVHLWNGGPYSAHKEYYDKAVKIMSAGFDPADVEKLLEIL